MRQSNNNDHDIYDYDDDDDHRKSKVRLKQKSKLLSCMFNVGFSLPLRFMINLYLLTGKTKVFVVQLSTLTTTAIKQVDE